MLESLLPALTLVALGLLAPASLAAVALARGRHASVSSGLDRGGRVAVAATLAASAGGTTAWLVGAGPVAALGAGLLLAAPIIVWAYLAPWWPVRAVVAWTMLVTGAVGLVGLAAALALESSEPWTAVPVAGAGAGAVVVVLERINGPFRRLLGIRAGVRRAVRTPLFLRPVLLRPALAVAVFFAALAAGGLTGVAPGPGGTRVPQAGAGPEPGRGPAGRAGLDASDVSPVSASTATPAETAGGRSTTSGGAGDEAGEGAGSGSGTAATSTGTTTPTAGGVTGRGPGSGPDADGSGSGPPGGGGAGGTGDDPVAQVEDTVEDTVRTVVDTAGDVTGDETSDGGALEPVQDAVEDTVGPVEDVVAPVESTVEDTVDQITDPIGFALP